MGRSFILPGAAEIRGVQGEIADTEARQMLEDARTQMLVTLFKGAELRLGKDMLNLDVNKKSAGYQKATTLGMGVASAAGAFTSTNKVATTFVENILYSMDTIPKALVPEIKNMVCGTSDFTKFVKTLPSVLGIGVTAITVAGAAANVASYGKAVYKQSSRVNAFLPGDPQAAAAAVGEMLKRELGRSTIDLTRHTVALGGKIGALFGDGGVVSGQVIDAANGLAGLGLEVYRIADDYHMMKRGNELLKHPGQLNSDVFAQCPILGCYLLLNADTSMIGNFMIRDMGSYGWMDKFEMIKKNDMDPLILMAGKVTNTSRIHIANMSSNKGTTVGQGLPQKMFSFFRKKYTSHKIRKSSGLKGIDWEHASRSDSKPGWKRASPSQTKS